MSPINLDADPEDADWIKTLSWDLPRDSETSIRTELGDGPPEEQAALADFFRLPTARAMPAVLPAEIARRALIGAEG